MRSVFIVVCSTLLVLPAAEASGLQQNVPESRVAGRVVSAAGSGLNGVAITIRSAMDSVVVAGVLAGRDGRYTVSGLPPGRYLIRVSLIGYEPATLSATVPADGGMIDTGRTVLNVQAVALDSIEVSADRSPVVIASDRTIYHTKDTPAADGGTAADVLRHIDELEVDFNGRVAMRGNRPVAIHINGRPAPIRGEQLQEFLMQLPGKAVARVEVLPNPSARYDPEGMGGIVNIVLENEARLGLSGSLGMNANSNGALGGNGRIALQKGQLTVFAGGSGRLSDYRGRTFDLRQHLSATPTSFFEQQSRDRNDNVIAFGDYSIEYKLGSRTVAWTNGYASAHAHDSNARVVHSIYHDSAQVIDRYLREITSESPHWFVDWGVGFKRLGTQRGHELTVDFRRTTNDGRNSSDALRVESMDPALLNERIARNATGLTHTSRYRADYMRPFGQHTEVVGGLDVSRRTIAEDTRLRSYDDTSAPSPTLDESAVFSYGETVTAAYLTGTRTIGRLAVQGGLRTELSRARISIDHGTEEFRSAYNSLFPSLNLSMELTEGRSVRLGYSKRIGRPPTQHLAPVRFTEDPTIRIEGNPDLGPNYTHMLNADFNWVGRLVTLRVAPYFRSTTDNWEPIRRLDPDGVMVITWANTASNRQLGSSFTLTKPATGRIGGSFNLTVYHNTTDATNVSPDYKRSALLWSTGGTLNVKAGSLTTGTASFSYMAARDMPQGRMDAMLSSSLGVRRQLFNRKATLNLFINDPLDLHRSRLEYRDPAFVQLSRTVPRVRAANLSITYNFGAAPQQQSRRDTEVPSNN